MLKRPGTLPPSPPASTASKAKADARAKAKDISRQLQAFVQGKRVLIVDPNPGIRAIVINIFKQFGSRPGDIHQVADYDSAVALIQKTKPQILVCDYLIGQHSGLGLLMLRNRELQDASGTLSVIITANSQESSIVAAAEGDVDCYILKPFTANSVTGQICRAILEKARPGPYRKAIDLGRVLAAKQEFRKAEQVFRGALELHPKPVLAHYNLGRIHAIQREYEKACDAYRKGLGLWPRHYRCLIGLFDVQLNSGKKAEAFDTGREILACYPVSPHRLEQMLGLAMDCRKFEDLEHLYDHYLELDHRGESLTRRMIEGLELAGRAALEERQPERAATFFRKAMVSSGRSVLVLRDIITALIEKGFPAQSAEFFKEYPQSEKNSPEFRALDYLLLDHTGTAAQVFEQGMRLVKDGVHDPLVYRILIRRALELGKQDVAEQVAADAARRYPGRKAEFLGLLGTTH